MNDLHKSWNTRSQVFKYHRYRARLAHSCAIASVESKMATTQHKTCVREFNKTESPTALQRAFRLSFNIQSPARKSICRWNHQFEQISCLCKGKISGRPRVSEENVRRIQESFERSPRKSTRTASKRTWNTVTKCLAYVEAPFNIQLSPSFWIILYFKHTSWTDFAFQRNSFSRIIILCW